MTAKEMVIEMKKKAMMMEKKHEAKEKSKD